MCEKIDFVVCRLCLNSGGPLINIFDENNQSEFMLEKTIEDLINVKVVEDANYSWLVCSTCMEKLTEFRLFKRRCTECLLVFYNRIQMGWNPARKDWIINRDEDSDAMSHEKKCVERPGDNMVHGTSSNVWALSNPVVSVDHSLRPATVETGDVYTAGSRMNWIANNNKYEDVDIQFPTEIKEVDDDPIASDAVDSSAVDVQDGRIAVKEEVDPANGCSVDPDIDTGPSMVTSMRERDCHWSGNDEAVKLEASEDRELELSLNEEVDIKEECDGDFPEELGCLAVGPSQEEEDVQGAREMDPRPVKVEGIRRDVDAEAVQCTSDDEADVVVFKCAICLRGFSVKGKLKRHMLTHTNERPFKCTVCSKGFNHKQHLEGHILSHTGQRPHRCDICTKTFILKQHLIDHVRIHVGEKRQKCHVCLKAFLTRQQLTKHMLTHSGEKGHACQVCSKAFSQKANLKRHMLIHTNERRHKCQVCAKSFLHKQHLECHMLTHTGERPFKCEVCPKSFTLKQNLKGHMHTHTGEKPFKCEVCSKSFRRKKHLQEHMSKHRQTHGPPALTRLHENIYAEMQP